MEEGKELIVENEIAQDWLYDFSNYPGLKLVEMSLYIVTQERNFIDKTLAQEALIACEVLARLNGQAPFKNKYTKPIDQWVEQTQEVASDQLKNKAHYAIDKIMSQQSELMSLALLDKGFRETLSNLKKRVKA